MTFIPNINNSYAPKCWKVSKGEVIYTSTWGRLPINGKCLFYKVEIEKKDSLAALNDYQEILDSLIEFYNNDTTIARAKITLDRHSRHYPKEITPLDKWLASNNGIGKKEYYKSILMPISYDVVPLVEGKYLFYLRNKKELSKWAFEYRPNSIGLNKEKENWEYIVTYSSDSTKILPKYKLKDQIEKDNYNFNSIDDEAFFEGHFIVIIQRGIEFLFNLTTGNIYLLTQKRVKKIGEIITVSSNGNQRYLVEDRDKAQILVTGEIRRYSYNDPFPNIRRMDMASNIREILERFE